MYIWQTVWLNPSLEELELEMTLEPCLRSNFSTWLSIKGGWIQRHKPDVSRSSYYGDHGQGTVHRRIGIGDYLDNSPSRMLKSVRQSWVALSFRRRRGSLSALQPTPSALNQFKKDCIDQGFALPERMREQVVISQPENVAEKAKIAREIKSGEVKLIDLGTKKKPEA
ncbi:hypothetical protein PAAG_09041 [Paracoccidioides lutzii Pb01]|uniref:Uncharacterized protein n=1 Tax=Paracoccidioides lutzii (strain ATCC MYA-826 / Pb01) TaxID=502779 RepID=C1HE48_PARBA|nr:hypothetical protein PAAG_09041 [Paracoccidioides lutzii Pb01]EEH40588.1 hypothetical protein PAAG_09041 [Paracoccidioides lutzii Pb01]